MLPEFDPDAILASLKTFQRRTVDHAFQRMYLDANPTTRFLVADEVGLGKTMIARGIIAKAVHYLTHETTIDRIDIVYVCSNAAIAKQNVNRLNVLRDSDLTLATRLTLLPIQMGGLRKKRRGQKKKINLVSFTPGTTFDLKSRGGKREERLVLYFLLKGMRGIDETGLRRALRGGCGAKNWRRYVRNWDEALDVKLAREFRKAVQGDGKLLDRLRYVCAEVRGRRGKLPRSVNRERLHVTGALRELLARVCAKALEPDLIIFDEFQRFRELLEVDEPSEAAELARSLMGFRDDASGMEARVLLLSATPYRMLTMQTDEGDDHHADFIRTLRFLFEGSAVEIAAIEEDFRRLRCGLFGVGVERKDAEAVRDRLEQCLRRVMARTERVGATLDRDAMLMERILEVPVGTDDLRVAQTTGHLAHEVGAHDTVEYWKSAPYLLNLMRDYELKRKIATCGERPGKAIASAIGDAQRAGLERATVEAYEKLDPGNARLRVLFRDTLDQDQWRRLWMPPSLPYWTPTDGIPEGPTITKSLVFSSWNVVPDAISAVTSYEAERRMIELDGEPPEYSLLNDKRSPLLQFKVESGRPGGMTTLALFYPSVALVRAVDPLKLALDLRDGKLRPPLAAILDSARDQIETILESIPVEESEEQRTDLAWHWSVAALLDADRAPAAIDWCADRRNGWRTVGVEQEGDRGGRFGEHIDHFVEMARGGEVLGSRPDDLIDSLGALALAGPGTCSLRALGRIFPERSLDDPVILNGAALIAEGLRSLFNQPTAIARIRSGNHTTPYWRLVLEYGLEGNLQAVLDEYLHVLRDSLGLGGRESEDDAVQQIAKAACAALSLRTSRVKVDEFIVRGAGVETDSFNLRTRFALRFGDMKDDSGATVARAGAVREAFNSPFHPFILASTSVGQEGLDFHSYCHALYHWNLPSNPVDLEQREGRVHRFKGHAVRKNIAAEFGLDALADGWDGRGDPWSHLFDTAARATPDRAGDLIPYWVYERPNGAPSARIERRVPILPLSKERSQLVRLKRGLALYRLVFGQPRQQELLEYLASRSDEADSEALRISLAP